MTRALRSVLSRNFEDIRGAHVAGTLPISEDLINAALNEEIQAPHGPVQQFEVRIGENNRLQVGLRVAVGPFSKWFRPELHVDPQALDGQTPVIRFIIASSHYGILVGLIERLSKGKLPMGVRIENQRISIDLGSVPQTAAYRQFFQHLKQLVITTRSGVISIDFEAKVQ
jgi:hypothetical protein